MSTEELNNGTESAAVRPVRRRYKTSEEDRFFFLRNVLNIIFMIGAVAGVVVYLTVSDTTWGIIIILTAMMFKIAECCFRFIH